MCCSRIRSASSTNGRRCSTGNDLNRGENRRSCRSSGEFPSLLPQFPQRFAQLRVVHDGEIGGQILPSGLGPDHEGVHRSFDMDRFAWLRLFRFQFGPIQLPECRIDDVGEKWILMTKRKDQIERSRNKTRLTALVVGLPEADIFDRMKLFRCSITFSLERSLWNE